MASSSAVPTGEGAAEADATDRRLLLLRDGDDVLVVRRPIEAGETIRVAGHLTYIASRLDLGHKVAVRAVSKGSPVLKYGSSIGHATVDIVPGQHVHLHNLASDYTPSYVLDGSTDETE